MCRVLIRSMEDNPNENHHHTFHALHAHPRDSVSARRSWSTWSTWSTGSTGSGGRSRENRRPGIHRSARSRRIGGENWSAGRYRKERRSPRPRGLIAVLPSTLVELLRWPALQQPEQRIYAYLVDGEIEGAHLTHEALDTQARAIGALPQSQRAGGDRTLRKPTSRPEVKGFHCPWTGSTSR